MAEHKQLDAIWTKIEKAPQIAIFRHVNPDPDAYGSQFALAQIIRDNFPQKRIYCYGERVERLSYIYEDCPDMFTTLPTTLDDMLIITVDTANKERIDNGGIDLPKIDIKIDHHPNLDHYAIAEYVNDNTPATCAILLGYFLSQEKRNADFIIQTSVYEKLYAGIIGDTGNFSYGKGLNQAFFNNVGIIFEKIDTKKMLARFFQKTRSEVVFKGFIATQIQTIGAFAFVAFDSTVVEKHDVTLDYATSLVNIMSEIENIEVWASFCEDKKNQIIRCSLRSRYHNISLIAQQFGGGGHPNASGVRVKTWDEVEQIKQAVINLVE